MSFFGTLALKDAATLLLLLSARTIFVFALCHLLLANLTHEIKEDLCEEERTQEMSGRNANTLTIRTPIDHQFSSIRVKV